MLATDLPTGTITFLFTDVEGSTRLLEQDAGLLESVLRRHDQLLSIAIASHHGFVFETVGDAFYVAFLQATDAIAAAIDAQLALQTEPWDSRAPIRARMAIHTGEVERRGSKYFGAPLFRSARLLSTAHGGQVVASSSTAELVRDGLTFVRLQDLGEHRLRDLTRPERIWQINHPDLQTSFPPLRSLTTIANNLPTQLTTFVGRERAITDTRRILGTTRLLTLLGAGGAGKTRLATQLGAEVSADFDDGVWFVDLAPVTNPDHVPQIVASALGINARPNQTPLAAVLSHLETRRILLILDNCEHLIAACARTVDSLLRRCLRVTVLATSRELLGVPGEVNWRVPSLSVPPPRQVLTVDQVSQYEAVRLFVDRAVTVSPGFQVTNQNAPAVAQICWRLDGIPLAIELAASRVRVLSVEQIAARLDDCFKILTGGSRTLLPRQQTLRALIDWSYDLLSAAEKLVLNRLATFSGSFSLEAAESIASGGIVAQTDVLDVLGQLVDKSLVQADEQAGPTRYRLLESMRQYAHEKLVESGARHDARECHANYYVQLAENAEPHLSRSDRAVWLTRLEPEFDNFRAVLAGSVNERLTTDNGSPLPELGLRLAGALVWYWMFRGAFAEGQFWFATLLADPGRPPSPALGKALNAAGTLSGMYGQSDDAKARFQAAAAIARQNGDKIELGRALVILSAYNDASDGLSENNHLTAGQALYRDCGNIRGLALSLRLAGVLALQKGNRTIARSRQEAALALYRTLADSWFSAQTLNSLGDIARLEMDDHSATTFYEEALTLCRGPGLSGLVPSLLHNLGHLARRSGDSSGAITRFREAASSFSKNGDVRGVAECLGGLAMACAAGGQNGRAARLFGASEAILTATGAAMWPANRAEFDECRDELKARDGDAAFFDEYSRGRAMSADQALSYALSDSIQS